METERIDLSGVRQKVCAELNPHFPNASPVLCSHNHPFVSWKNIVLLFPFLNTFCFLLRPFSLHYSFFLLFCLKYLLFFVRAKLSLTPPFSSSMLLSVPTGLWAFLAGSLWAPQAMHRGLAEGCWGLCRWDFAGWGSLVQRQRGHSMAQHSVE